MLEGREEFSNRHAAVLADAFEPLSQVAAQLHGNADDLPVALAEVLTQQRTGLALADLGEVFKQIQLGELLFRREGGAEFLEGGGAGGGHAEIVPRS